MQSDTGRQRHERKVCILSSVHDADDIRIFYKEAVSLANAGHEVTFIVKHDKEETVGGVRLLPLKQPANRLKRMVGTVWEVWRKALKEKADIYHFHDPELIPVGLLLKMANKKVIYDVHEDVPKQILAKHWIPKPIRKTVSWLAGKVEHFAAKRFDAVITVTDYNNRRFSRYASRVVTVGNYPLLSEFAETPSVKKERAVCYIGGISRDRGLFEMVNGMGMTDVKLLFAGPAFRQADREAAQNLKGWGQLQDLGQLNREEVAAAMARAVAGLILYHPVHHNIDSQPNKLYEYMAAGIPVIATNFKTWREIVEGNDCGICIDPLDTVAIAKTVLWMANHPEEAARMGRNGKEAVVNKYSWETQESVLLALYDGLLAPSSETNKTKSQGKEVTFAE